jgi:hypothetical protein
VKRCICSSSPDASSKVLPLSSVYGHSIEVMGLAAYDANIFVGKVGRRKIVEEVYPIEGIRLLPVHVVRVIEVQRRGGLIDRRYASGLICTGMSIVEAVRPGRTNLMELIGDEDRLVIFILSNCSRLHI